MLYLPRRLCIMKDRALKHLVERDASIANNLCDRMGCVFGCILSKPI